MIVRIQKDLILASAITWKYMQMIWTVKYRDRHFGGFYACCKNGSLKIGCYIYERIPKSYATSQEIYSFLPTDSPPSNESYFKGSLFNFSSKRKKGSWFMMPTSIHIGRLQRGLAAPIAPHLSVCVWCRCIPSLMIH